MGKSIKAYLGLLFVGPIVIAGVAVLALIFGAAAGFIGGMIFPQVFERLSQLVFGEPVPAWQIGAMLGFVAAFLRASIAKRS